MTEQQRRVSNLITQLLKDWQKSTGESLDKPDTKPEDSRLGFFVLELVRLEITEAHVTTRSRPWVLYGDPSKYKRITPGDFYPSNEQLQAIGLKTSTTLGDYWSGYRAGHAAGMLEQFNKDSEDRKYVQLRAKASKLLDLENLRNRLAKREERILQEEEHLRIREAELIKSVKMLRYNSSKFLETGSNSQPASSAESSETNNSQTNS